MLALAHYAWIPPLVDTPHMKEGDLGLMNCLPLQSYAFVVPQDIIWGDCDSSDYY